jgi:hypothetical protein
LRCCSLWCVLCGCFAVVPSFSFSRCPFVLRCRVLRDFVEHRWCSPCLRRRTCTSAPSTSVATSRIGKCPCDCFLGVVLLSRGRACPLLVVPATGTFVYFSVAPVCLCVYIHPLRLQRISSQDGDSSVFLGCSCVFVCVRLYVWWAPKGFHLNIMGGV